MSETAARPRPTLDQLHRYAEHFNASATLKNFGVRVEFPDVNRVHCIIDPIRPEQRGGLGTDAVNGGVIAAMFDLSIGVTAALVDPLRASATQQLSMSFLRPLKGTSLKAEAKIDHMAKRTLFATAAIYDGAGTLCATAQGLVKFSNRDWLGGAGSPAIN